jgi:aminopeptidase-like protein
MNVLAYSDGEHDLLDLGERIGVNAVDCLDVIRRLESHGLVERVDRDT